MPTPSSGTIRFSDISNEFGLPPGRNLGAYRVSQSVGTLSNLPLDVGIPQSGTIRFSDFYNKRLNVVVNFTNLGDNARRLNARNDYNSNSPGRVVVIGGFRGRPSSPQNIRVFINFNTRIGSSKGSRTNVAVRTGDWRNSSGSALSTVRLEFGPSSKIYGAGGNGGNASGGNGTNGTSAVGVDYPTTVINRGRIQQGGGGGGAGAFRRRNIKTGKKKRTDSKSTGGGGGGGAGFPFSAGGAADTSAFGLGTNGSAGAGGSYESAGAGGAGGNEAGSGGSGGQFGTGSNGGSTLNQSGGIGAVGGFSIIISPSASGTSIQNFGTIIGPQTTANPT